MGEPYFGGEKGVCTRRRNLPFSKKGLHFLQDAAEGTRHGLSGIERKKGIKYLTSLEREGSILVNVQVRHKSKGHHAILKERECCKMEN